MITHIPAKTSRKYHITWLQRGMSNRRIGRYQLLRFTESRKFRLAPFYRRNGRRERLERIRLKIITAPAAMPTSAAPTNNAILAKARIPTKSANRLARRRAPPALRPALDLVYQPMLKLLAALRGNGFKAAASSSAPSPNRATASHPSRSSARTARPDSSERPTASRCWSRRPRWIACLYGSNCCATVRTDDGSFPTC
jgi:hypothetical protein